ncbi:hypothetical protein V8B55DRAFT_1452183 [Mucor lusitanicus]|uniref:Uncharacterized protein n=1 Tax=Mucor circinelloides f. lusitanicus TaxID=29924 RepID=A0A8H4B926_MUCCL|nr:hypothetical protein FB192DRAFT_1166344 [Mucor lusitanicus]
MRSVADHEKPFGQKIFLSSRRQQQPHSSSSNSSNNSLRGIHINISSDPFQHRIPPYIQRLWQESRLRKHLSIWRRRLTKRYQQAGVVELVLVAVCVFAGCIVLLVHVGFFSGKKYQDWQQEHYSDPLDEVDLLDKVYPDEGRSQTTAVVLLKTQNELESTARPILEQLCQYDMFSKFIVWNDDPTVNMTLDMIQAQGCTPNRLQIINAPIQMGSSARYHACRLSKTPYCYFQDTPRKSQKLRSTYANFLRSPHLIHGESADHAAFINSQWRYCFSNTALQLHTCFIDIESGTFVAKAMVSKFLQNYDKTSVVDAYADMYFMMYINQVPYQLEGNDNEMEAPAKELTEKETEHMDLGLTILYNDLEEGEGIVPLEPYLESTFDRNARASCKDDRCLFLTNKQLFPNIDLFSYNPSIYVDVLKQMHDDYMVGSYKDYRYSNAVDMREETSWKSVQNIRAGDYIGLDMLMPMRTSLIYRFLVNHPYSYRSSLNIQISYDGLLWIKLHPAPSINCQNVDDPRSSSSSSSESNELLECRFIVTDTGYRYIRLESQKDLDFPFDVHDLSFSAKVKKDANGQILDIALNEDGIIFIEDDLN